MARHKLVDYWRRAEREQRGLRLVQAASGEVEDPWDAEIDTVVAHQALDALGPHHRAALTLRYLDGLPVRQVAEHLGRTVHLTEAPAPRWTSTDKPSTRGGVANRSPWRITGSGTPS